MQEKEGEILEFPKAEYKEFYEKFVQHFFTQWGEKPLPDYMDEMAMIKIKKALGNDGERDLMDLDILCSYRLAHETSPQDEILQRMMGNTPMPEVVKQVEAGTKAAIERWKLGLSPREADFFNWLQIRRLRWAHWCNNDAEIMKKIDSMVITVEFLMLRLIDIID